jgi:ribosomal protein L23
MRDGVWLEDKTSTPYAGKRVATSFALHHVYAKRHEKGSALFLNVQQKSSSGKALEVDVGSAAVVASHSYEGVGGCPVSFFIRAMIAELNPHRAYVHGRAFALVNLPAAYDNICIPLLSAVNEAWKTPDTDFAAVQDSSIFLGNYEWSQTSNLNNGHFPICVLFSTEHIEMCAASTEAKGHQGKGKKVGALKQTVEYTVNTQHCITFMVNTDARKPEFEASVKNCHVVQVTGEQVVNGVAQRLVCHVLHEHPSMAEGNLPPHTVVVIVLESIYPGRYKMMQRFYQSA